MTESTAMEQPAGNSIASDLSAALAGFDDDMNVISTDEVTEEPEIEETASNDDESTSDESEDSESQESELEEVKNPKKSENPKIEAPSHWSPADKEIFKNAPPELQKWMIDRHKSMEGDYTRKSQEIAEFKRSWEPVKELFAPHIDQLRATGQTPASVITHWANINNSLNNNPAETIKWLASQYNVDLSGQIGDNDIYIDPHVQSLRQELQQLKQSVVQREQYATQQRLSTVQSELQMFAEAKTEAGELAHPYFEEVVEDMVSLAKAEQAGGKTPTVGDLYDRAVWANPTVREKLLAAQRDAAAKKAEQEARAKAAKAKIAKKTLRSSPDGEVSGDLTLRQQLEQAFN
jgi:hypothetical protein